MVRTRSADLLHRRRSRELTDVLLPRGDVGDMLPVLPGKEALAVADPGQALRHRLVGPPPHQLPHQPLSAPSGEDHPRTAPRVNLGCRPEHVLPVDHVPDGRGVRAGMRAWGAPPVRLGLGDVRLPVLGRDARDEAGAVAVVGGHGRRGWSGLLGAVAFAMVSNSTVRTTDYGPLTTVTG